jgi:hypothetical protein
MVVVVVVVFVVMIVVIVVVLKRGMVVLLAVPRSASATKDCMFLFLRIVMLLAPRGLCASSFVVNT